MTAIGIIVAGGSSRRMGYDKLLADIAGEPVLIHTLRAFEYCGDIGQILLVAPESRVAFFQEMAAPFSKVAGVLAGGAERHLSVWAGLQNVPPDFEWVAVHDAARPLVQPADISETILKAQEFGAAALAAPVSDTLNRASGDRFAGDVIDRTGVWAMQTPQVFQRQRLIAAYTAVLSSGDLVTDEVSAVAKLGDAVKLVPSSDLNFKITFPCDIELAHAVLSMRRARMTGHPVFIG